MHVHVDSNRRLGLLTLGQIPAVQLLFFTIFLESLTNMRLV